MMIKQALFLLLCNSFAWAQNPVIVSVVDQGILKLPYMESHILRDKSYDFSLNSRSQGIDHNYDYDNTVHGSFIAFKIISNQKDNIKLLDIVYEFNQQASYYSLFVDSSLAIYRRKQFYKKQTQKILESWDLSVQQGAKVINFSSGSPYFDESQIKNWLSNNPQVYVVVSAGNESRNLDKYPHYPCSIKAINLFCVGSVNKYLKKSEFSNYGKFVLKAFGDHSNYKGTSFAAPEVSRYIAQEINRKKQITSQKVRQLVEQKFGYF